MNLEQYTVTTESAAALADDLAQVGSIPGVRCAVVADRSGRIMASAGATLGSADMVAFASLAAADFNANEQLASLVGERGFRALVHRGENASVHVEGAGAGAVLIVLFGSPAAPGLVRELSRTAADRAAMTLSRMMELERLRPTRRESPFANADDEIDRLFDW